MALVNRRSDLTTLKFGRDRRGGGHSGQPYVTKAIPDRDQSIDFATSFLGNDFINRGGVVSLENTLQDQERLLKYLTGAGKSVDGLLFTAKQNMLAKHNVVTGAEPDRSYNPLNTIAQAGVVSTGRHYMKDGKDLIIDDNNKYFKLTKDNTENGYNSSTLGAENKNKLLLLYETKVLNTPIGPDVENEAFNSELRTIENSGTMGRGALRDANRNTSKTTSTTNLLKSNLDRFGISVDSRDILFSYQGGPNSTVGGKTTIRRSPEYDTNKKFYDNQRENNEFFKLLTFSPEQLSTIPSIRYTRSTGYGSSSIRNFLTSIPSSKAKNTRIGKPTDYTKYNRSNNLGEGDPGKVGKNKSVYYTTNLKNAGSGVNVYTPDKINAQKLYTSDNANPKNKDIIKFHIGVVDLDNYKNFSTWIHFRAYITSFSDNYNAEWQGYKYMGRGNSFYRYNGYERNISMAFDVALQSRYEQPVVYSKLNYLASLLAPNYSNTGYMRGNIIKITIGDYLNNTYGILKSLNYTIPEDAAWDIGDIKPDEEQSTNNENSGASQLPMRINVGNFEFTPIHNFYDSTVTEIKDTPSQRFISMGNNGEGYPSQQSVLN